MRHGKVTFGYIHGEKVKPSWGRRQTRRAIVERQEVISVSELHRAKAFGDRWVSFPNFGLMLTAISRLRACRHQAELFIATRDGPQRQVVPVLWTYCRVGDRGGWRPWFRCKCGRRAGKLYNAGVAFECRKCCKLVYECQLKSSKGRLERAATKIRHRLSWAERRWAFRDKLPPRPHGMRTAKYRELISRLIAIDRKIALRKQKRGIERAEWQPG
jgi:hypothetical protein